MDLKEISVKLIEEVSLPGADGSTFDADKEQADRLWKAISFDEKIPTRNVALAEVRPMFRDLSKYQGLYNFPIAVTCGAKLFYIRAGVSWGTPDPAFAGLYAGAGAVGKPRTSYHVLYPDQPVVKQADDVWYKQHPEIDKVPRVIDLEVDRGVSHQQVADRTWQMSELVLSRDGIRPLIYSRYLLINAWLQTWTTEMLNAHKYVLAQYLFDRTKEHPGPPILPNRVLLANVIGHQTADKKPGCEGEAESSAVDYNRWTLGDEAQMDAWMAENWGIGDPIPEPPPLGQLLMALRDLTVYQSPGYNSQKLGIVEKDNVIMLDTFSGGKINVGTSHVWIKHPFEGGFGWTPTHTQAGERQLSS